jgi:putative inorganic carbon (HCO3(-)) transporter
LWGAALRLIQTRPLLGYGPDNFRHLYGAQLGLETWDERIQANNVYLEILVDLGVLGLAAFAWLVWRPLVGTIRAIHRPGDGSPSLLIPGVALGVLAFLVHGLLDSFLAFTPIVLLLWMLLGVVRLTTHDC